MAAWSPSDLTNPSFVKTQLSDKDRSNALFTTSNELTSAEARLKQQGAILAAAQEAQNNGPARGQINALKAKSNDTSLPAAEREQAAQQAADLADQRDKNNVAAANALEKFNSTNQYVNDLESFDFIKIDTETQDYQILKSMMPLIQSLNKKPFILFENNYQNQMSKEDAKKILDDFTDNCGYEPINIDELFGDSYLKPLS